MRKKIYEIIELDEQGNLWSKIYDRIMLVAIVVSIIPLMFRGNREAFSTIESLITILFTADYILRWLTEDFRHGRTGIKSFLLYPFTLAAIIDLLSILPIFSYFNQSLRVLRTWRLIRLVRIVKVIKYYEPLQIVIEVFRRKASILLTVVGFALFYIFVTALLMFNVEQTVDPQTGQLFFEDFFDALYWSTCTLTTVGYGDIYPTTNIGRIVSMISALVGIAIIALPSGIITAGYIEEVQERNNKKQEKVHKEEQ